MFIDGKYISKDTWYDADGKAFQPQVHCTWCDGYPCLVHAKADRVGHHLIDQLA